MLFLSEQTSNTVVKCSSCVKRQQKTLLRFRSSKHTTDHWSWKVVPRAFWNLKLNSSKLFNLKLVWDFLIVKGTFYYKPSGKYLSNSGTFLNKRQRKNRSLRQNQAVILLHQILSWDCNFPRSKRSYRWLYQWNQFFSLLHVLWSDKVLTTVA